MRSRSSVPTNGESQDMSSPYVLSVDVRAGALSAAIAERGPDGEVHTTAVAVGRTATMPTAVFVSPDDLLFGVDAIAAGEAEPDRLVADFVGDATGVLAIDGQEFARADLLAWLIDAAINQVEFAQDASPAGVWVVVPAEWNDDRLDEIMAALDRDGRTEVDFVTLPEALAERYDSLDPADAELNIIVCDADEHRLSAAIVRIVPGGEVSLLSAPVTAALGTDEALDDRLRAAVESLGDALEAAGLDDDDLDAVVLSGSFAGLERVQQLLSEEFGDPIDIDPQPAMAAAHGAAFALAREGLESPAVGPTSAAALVPVPSLVPPAPELPVASAELVPAQLVPTAPAELVRDTPTELAAIFAAAPTAVIDPVPVTFDSITAVDAPAAEPKLTRPWFRRPAGIVGIGTAAAAVIVALGFGTVFAIGGGIGSDTSVEEADTTPSPQQRTTATSTPTPTRTPSASAKPTPTPTPTPSAPGAVPDPFNTTPPYTPPQIAEPPVVPAPAPPATVPDGGQSPDPGDVSRRIR